MFQVQNQFKCLLLILASGLFGDVHHDAKEEGALSARELQILSYLACGKSAREIGAQLGISKRTVEHHLENIKHKTNCNSKAELIDLCWTGWLTNDITSC